LVDAENIIVSLFKSAQRLHLHKKLSQTTTWSGIANDALYEDLISTQYGSNLCPKYVHLVRQSVG